MVVNNGWICPMCETVNSNVSRKCRKCGDDPPTEVDPEAETKEMPPVKIEEDKHPPDTDELADAKEAR